MAIGLNRPRRFGFPKLGGRWCLDNGLGRVWEVSGMPSVDWQPSFRKPEVPDDSLTTDVGEE